MELKTEKIIINDIEYIVREMNFADELNYIESLDRVKNEKNRELKLSEKQELFVEQVISPYVPNFLSTITREQGHLLFEIINKLNKSPSK
jgi:hypothetical protein